MIRAFGLLLIFTVLSVHIPVVPADVTGDGVESCNAVETGKHSHVKDRSSEILAVSMAKAPESGAEASENDIKTSGITAVSARISREYRKKHRKSSSGGYGSHWLEYIYEADLQILIGL